jgi:hypothetical protein
MFDDNTVKVYTEKPNEKDGFHYAICYLPKYKWTDIFGFSEEVNKLNNIIFSFIHTQIAHVVFLFL